jgi:NAD(P)-dependent dehydrogenase (short-subunit alcohol dehydrogenase family)
MPNVLVTGSNRGLGLEFVRQYQAAGWRVFACCRDPAGASALRELAGESTSIHALDVSDFAAIAALAAELSSEALDLLINNAGVFGDGATLGELDYEAIRRTLEVNTLSPLCMAECFLPHVERGNGKKIVNVTSKMGSITDNTSGGRYAYRSSKAALNMATKSLALDLGARATAIVIHPGWVAPLQPPESVKGMRDVIAGLRPEDSGRFFNYDGQPLPW